METIIGHLQTLTVLFFCARLALGSPLTTKRDPICQNVTFPITISSNNARLPAELDLSGTGFESFLTDLVGWVFDAVVEGTFNIAASYCEPEVRIPSRENTLQLLVHGATYDRNYWSGVGAPGHGYGGDEYSWVAYASQQGYPTLAIDRLGNGDSDHPDPLQVVQMPAHAEIAHGIVQLARAGSSLLPRAFDKIIYVGHSFGSLIGNLVNEKYPNDVDATVLTGWSDNFVIAGIPIALGLVTLPSPVVDPIRFGDLSAGYLEVTSESGDVAAFFHEGDYDPALQSLQFTRRGTISVGELLTFPFATTKATGYEAPILVATAEEDAIFCNPTAGLLPANCGTGDSNMLAMSRSLYPVASVYHWYVVPNAGHCWQLHYTAQEGFNASHEWLAERGL